MKKSTKEHNYQGMGKIIRAYGWEFDGDELFITINPLADEVSLYKTHPSIRSDEEDILKSQTRKGFSNLRCFDYSPSLPGLVGVGQDDGSVKLFDILTPHSAALEIKQNRRVNDLSFNSQGLVALGMEKSKSGSSLQIFNINHYSKNSNQELQQPTFSFLPNDSVVSSIFYNETNLLVGSPKFLRDIDIRVSAPVFQIPSKTIFGITQDPYNQFNFASFAEDGTVSIYDRRKLTNSSPDPVLSFNKLMGDTTRRNNNSCLRYSPNRRGEFATSHIGELIRRWQTGSIPTNKYDSLFVASVLDVKTKYDRVISFEYSSDLGCSKSLDFICMRQSGSVFKMPVIESQKSLHFNSFNDLVFTGSSGTIIEGVDEVANKIQDLDLKASLNSDNNDDLSQLNGDFQNPEVSLAQNYTEEGEDGGLDDEDEIGQSGYYSSTEVLENDISVKMRRRAYLGYGTNCVKNMEIVDSLKSIENNLFLKSTWRWLEIAQTSSNSGLMTTNDLDLSYEGVLGIWKGVEGLQRQDRFGDLNLTQEVFEQRITDILSSRKSKNTSIVKTKKAAQRKLGMILVGFYFSPGELEQVYSKLMKNGQYSKAAGWAVFIGDVNRAVQILSSSKSHRLRLIATAISGYLVQKQTTDDNIWKEQCRQMASELDDPYLKAIFAYIADNDWWDVLEESSLPLRERIGVAFRCLSDHDLTIFLNRVADRYISKGELEGLILTGITPRGMDLLQSYVDRTTDVQTAAIIASFGSPRYFKDERADHWIHCYRSLLNSWGMFSLRAKFDVSRAKLSRNGNGKPTLKPSGSQILFQCSRCNKNISKVSKSLKRSVPTSGKNGTRDISSCPSCGAPLPKCAICLLPLGKPLPKDVSESQRIAEPRIEEFKEWPSFCLTCNHGMHCGHAEEWFSKSIVCPVPGCLCHCNNK